MIIRKKSHPLGWLFFLPQFLPFSEAPFLWLQDIKVNVIASRQKQGTQSKD